MKKKFDIFFSYSSADRDAVVLPLLALVEAAGLRAWCDIHEIRWGDSIVEKIQAGLSESAFVIAIVSESYLRKPWPLKELSASLSRQTAGRVTVLPILLGVESEQIDSALPLLSDIRHLSIYNYAPSEKIEEARLQDIVRELLVAVGSIPKIKVTGPGSVTSLTGKVQTASFCSHYGIYRILTDREVQEVTYRQGQFIPESPPRSLSRFNQFILGLGGQPDSRSPLGITCCWDDIERYDTMAFGLENGDAVFLHGYCIEGTYEADTPIYQGSYFSTGAPQSPRCIIIEPHTSHVVLGYEDGRMYCFSALGDPQCMKNEYGLLSRHSGAITAIAASRKSIIVGGSADGELSIWSRQDYSLLHKVKCSDFAVTSLAIATDHSSAVVAVGLAAGTIELRNFQSDLLSRIQLSTKPITSTTFLPHPFRCVAVATGNTVFLLDSNDLSTLAMLQGPANTIITTLHATGNDKRSFLRDSMATDVLLTAGDNIGSVSTWRVML